MLVIARIMKVLFLKFLIPLFVFPSTNLVNGKLVEKLSWRYLNFTFESHSHYVKAVENGTYDYRKNVPVDMEWYDPARTLFVSVARQTGVPASLTTVDFGRYSSKSGGYLLRPFPNWESADMGTCESIINVYRTALDSCDRLWVLDNGFNGPYYHCPPKIMQYDLTVGELVKVLYIPSRCFTNRRFSLGMVTNMVVDIRTCTDYTLFISDSIGGSLIVYESSDNSFSRYKSSLMKAMPSESTFDVAGAYVTLPLGIVNLAVTREKALYFSALASLDISSANLSQINGFSGPERYMTYENAEPSQATSMSYYNRGALVIALSGQSSLVCMPVRDHLYPRNMVVLQRDSHQLQWTISQKMYNSSYGFHELMVISNRLTIYLTEQMHFNETNFRILAGNADEMMAGTECDTSRDNNALSTI